MRGWNQNKGEGIVPNGRGRGSGIWEIEAKLGISKVYIERIGECEYRVWYSVYIS